MPSKKLLHTMNAVEARRLISERFTAEQQKKALPLLEPLQGDVAVSVLKVKLRHAGIESGSLNLLFTNKLLEQVTPERNVLNKMVLMLKEGKDAAAIRELAAGQQEKEPEKLLADAVIAYTDEKLAACAAGEIAILLSSLKGMLAKAGFNETEIEKIFEPKNIKYVFIKKINGMLDENVDFSLITQELGKTSDDLRMIETGVRWYIWNRFHQPGKRPVLQSFGELEADLRGHGMKDEEIRHILNKGVTKKMLEKISGDYRETQAVDVLAEYDGKHIRDADFIHGVHAQIKWGNLSPQTYEWLEGIGGKKSHLTLATIAYLNEEIAAGKNRDELKKELNKFGIDNRKIDDFLANQTGYLRGAIVAMEANHKTLSEILEVLFVVTKDREIYKDAAAVFMARKFEESKVPLRSIGDVEGVIKEAAAEIKTFGFKDREISEILGRIPIETLLAANGKLLQETREVHEMLRNGKERDVILRFIKDHAALLLGALSYAKEKKHMGDEVLLYEFIAKGYSPQEAKIIVNSQLLRHAEA